MPSRRVWIVLLVALFLIAFFMRAYQPLSRPVQWLDRSLRFNQALDERDWAATYQSRHPGFTTMVVGGLSIRAYTAALDTPAERLFNWAMPPGVTSLYNRELVVGVVGLALVIAALLVAVTLVLRRLGGPLLALAAAGLMACEPFYLAQSRSMHVDALLATLMLLSALLLLLALRAGRRRYLLLSGLAGGFALLTKTPALFLVPFTGLALLAHLVAGLRAGWADHADRRARWLAAETWRSLVLPGLLWLLAAILPFALWPAMWVDPSGVLGSMFSGTAQHLVRGHKLPRFFAGEIYYGSAPGALFYPATVALNVTYLTLPLILVALGGYALWRKRGRRPLHPTDFWLLAAYVVFFTLQMSLGAKQVDRYILPVHPALDVLAAAGLVGLAGLLAEPLDERRQQPARALPSVLAALTVGLQAWVALAFAPDYGAHHNHLLGGNPTAVRTVEVMGQEEGIGYVIDYLADRPGAASLTVGTPRQLGFALRVWDFPTEVSLRMPPGLDYYLFYLPAMQRHLNPEDWEPTWEALQARPPELVVRFDGAAYLWLYAGQDDGDPGVVEIRRGGVGFIALAWAWTALLLLALLWALNRPAGRAAPIPLGVARRALRGWEWAAVVLILLIGFGLRAVRFHDAPPGVIHDEVWSWLLAGQIAGGDIRPLYALPYGAGREALYPLVETASFRLLGDNLLAARLPSMAFGMLGLALSFTLARRLFGRGAGMVAAAGMATSFWAVMFGRLALRYVSLPTLALLSAYLYLRLLEDRQPPPWRCAPAGLALAATLYTAPPAPPFALILLVWVMLLTVHRREDLRARLLPLALSFALAALAAIPLIRARSTPALADYARQLRAPLDAFLSGDAVPLLDNAGAMLGVFAFRGDRGLEFNVAGQPIFPTILLPVLFYLGLLWAAWKLFDARDRRRAGYGLALLWLAGLLIPALATERPASPARMIGLLGVVYLFPAVAVTAAYRAARRTGGVMVRGGIAALAALALVAQLGHTARRYFTTWVDDPTVRLLYQDEYRALAADLAAREDDSPVAVGGLTPYRMDPASLRLLMAGDTQVGTFGFFDPGSALLVPPAASPAETVYLIVPGFTGLHPALDAHLDAWGFRPDPPYPGAPYTRYALHGDRADLLAAAVDAPADFYAPGDTAGGPLIALAAVETTGSAVPGGGFNLLTCWRTHRPSAGSLRIFVHLTDEAGAIVAQSDVLGVPAPQWRAGDLVIQAHDLFLPPDAPPGPYWINVGLYDPSGGARLVTPPDLPTADHVRLPLPEN